MKNVVIIGAGPAGITAAFELLKKSRDYHVVILECSDTIGGISRTVHYNGNRMDIGGHRFFSKDDRVMEWWKDLMPLQGLPAKDDLMLKRNKAFSKDGPDPSKTNRVMLLRDRWSRIYYKGKFFDYPVKINLNTLRNMGLICTIKAISSYIASVIKKMPENSLENFYINRFGRVLYTMFFEGYTEKLWGKHPRHISAEWGAQRVKGLSIKAILADILGKMLPQKELKVETSLIKQFYYPKFGPGQLWETVAEEVVKMGGILHMNSLVKRIETKGMSACKVVYTDGSDERVIDADYVISSMPLKDLIFAMSKTVPLDIQKIAEGLPYRDFVTIGLLLKKLNLKNKTSYKTVGNIVPDCWIYVQETSVKVGRIQIFNNWSPYMVKDFENTIWIGLEYFCMENDSFWNMDKDECVNFAIGELVSMGIIESEEDVLDSHRERVKKAYPAYFDTYKDMDKLRKFIDSYENLFCIGRNGQHHYNNMDHSMLTAFEAVNLIISGSSDKSSIWDINTEKEFHEEKINS